MASDLFSTVKTYISKVADGERSPAEIANSANAWIKESTESIKIKVEEEVERSVSKMGFIKRSEFEELKREVAALKAASEKESTSAPIKKAKSSAKKIAKKLGDSAKKAAPTPAVAAGVKKKAAVKKSAIKKAAKTAAKGK